MVGRSVNLAPDKTSHEVRNVVLKVSGLTVSDPSGRALVSEVSFDLRAGEVLAIAGVQGNGQSELAKAIINLEDHVQGSITLGSRELVGLTVHDSLHEGIAFVPESREDDGLIASFSIAENLILDTHRENPYAQGISLSPKVIDEQAAIKVKEFDIRTQSTKDPASSLSGGNKQKVVLARELSRPVKLLVASQPTRGLDVGSIEFVHERILAERDSGRAVLLFSTELDEVLALADRIAVMYAGKILAIVNSDVSREKLGLLMAGVTK